MSTKKNNNLRRLRLIYGLFLGIIAICLALFMLDVVSSADDDQFTQLNQADPGYGMRITDLHTDAKTYDRIFSLGNDTDDLTIHAHINRFDVDIFAEGPEMLNDSRLMWVMALQIVSALMAVAIVVIAIVVLVSFYRNTKHGHLFPKRHVRSLVIIGVLLVLVSISIDISTFLEQCVALDILQSSEWQSKATLRLHFMRILFGLTIIFVAEILKIGHNMQEEQELTI